MKRTPEQRRRYYLLTREKEIRQMRAYRKANLEKLRAYDRLRYRRDNAKRVKLINEYSKTKAGKAVRKKARTKYYWNNIPKVRARQKTANAIRDGKLLRQPCEAFLYAKEVVLHGRKSRVHQPPLGA